MELCERLIELRKKANLSQEKLAEILDVSRQAVSKWETGASNPDIHHIIRLGEIYHVSIDDILLENPQETEPSIHQKQVTEKPQNGSSKFYPVLWFELSVLSIIILYYITN